jgi:methyl-accepting chemotaxis protein
LQTREMANSLAAHVVSTSQVSSNVLSVKDNLDVIAYQSQKASVRLLNLTNVSESIRSMLFDFGMTSKQHDSAHKIALKQAKLVQKLFGNAIANDILTESEFFDTRYQPIANTNPQKYHTQYDGFTDELLVTSQDAMLDGNKDLIFAFATDINGYVPTHNSAFSNVLTGNYDVDLVKNRTKRIFSDRVGKRCGSHTQTFLLQTYKRDTGEVMHDLSVPVYVKGKHWGCVRIGYLARGLISN